MWVNNTFISFAISSVMTTLRSTTSCSAAMNNVLYAAVSAGDHE